MALVLVVDDEPDIRELVRINLEQAGHRVVTAADGDEALASVRHEPPDALFLDVRMPGTDGWAVLEELKAGSRRDLSEIPVFMLTDQDAPSQCPPQLVQAWTKGERNSKFFLRVAVMEVESWVMADRRGFADFLSIPVNRIPENTDVILQPKEFLVSLARLSKKTRLRQEIVPLPGATSKVGPEYNSRLGSNSRS